MNLVEQKRPVVFCISLRRIKSLQSEILMAAVFYLVQSIIVTAGLLICGVGIFVAGPIIILAQALLYRGYFPEQKAAPPAA